MRSSVLACCILVGSLPAAAQIVPPRLGVEMPPAYFERIERDPTAFQFSRAWIGKTKRVKENRRLYRQLLSAGKAEQAALAAVGSEGTAVSGTAWVPVFMTTFANTPSPPYPTDSLQAELFDGPWPTGTMHDFYAEISYGNLNLTGTVYPWFQLANNDTYYEGTTNGLGSDSHVGMLIKETLQNWDGSVDFGLYDNDGPDGVPNSGDDDGYVDFVSFVHAESGGECGNSNIWSHRWRYSGWPESGYAPFTTNDPRAGGGLIKVEDYTIQPALACNDTQMIQIGVFCHEFGHAFGLPDLYDTNGGSSGIGHWGLMGSGNWNKPTSPAHMCAWSKAELGWITVVEVLTPPSPYSIDQVETVPVAYKLLVVEERWRRSGQCVLDGFYSMHLGLDSGEAGARNWPGGAGYGNGWKERLVRDFSYDGSTPVTLSYRYAYDTESGYDYANVKIRVEGTESLLISYDGSGSGIESGLDLTPFLTGLGVTTYQLIFEFTSDYAYSDEDGLFDSNCNGPFTIDDVSVVGGGENYFADFESYEDGWHEELPASIDEYFLVENREPVGFDQFLHGAGLAIWHVEDNIARTYLGNSGGEAGDEPHGLALEEADGLGDLMNRSNRGDAGDVYPGTSGNTLFDLTSNPASFRNDGGATLVSVSDISVAGATMTAMMGGGAFAPTVTSVEPSSGSNTGSVHIAAVLGTRFNFGATLGLRDLGGNTRWASQVEWVGHGKMSGDIDLTGLASGYYHVVVANPDGREGVLPGAFMVTGSTASGSSPIPSDYALYQNHPNPFNPATTIPFDVKEETRISLMIFDVEGRLVRTLRQGPLPAGHYDLDWDGRDQMRRPVASGVYIYRLRAGEGFEASRKMILLR